MKSTAQATAQNTTLQAADVYERHQLALLAFEHNPSPEVAAAVKATRELWRNLCRQLSRKTVRQIVAHVESEVGEFFYAADNDER